MIPNRLIEDQETLQDLELVLVRHGATYLVAKIAVIQRLHGLQTLVGKRWHPPNELDLAWIGGK